MHKNYHNDFVSVKIDKIIFPALKDAFGKAESCARDKVLKSLGYDEIDVQVHKTGIIVGHDRSKK